MYTLHMHFYSHSILIYYIFLILNCEVVKWRAELTYLPLYLVDMIRRVVIDSA